MTAENLIAASPENTNICPPIQRLVWHAPQRIRWSLADTPCWFSVGHTARIMCFIPLGIKHENGRSIETRDGSGCVYAVKTELRRVDEFAADSCLPLRTTLIAEHIVRAGDSRETGKRIKWPFPTEQGSDFELDKISPRRQETLFRIFDHPPDEQFWITLMIHAEADFTNMNARLTGACDLKCFTAFESYTIVCELLNDPGLSLTSTYIEPNDPPSTRWIANEKVKAPWSLNKTVLQHVKGSLHVDKNREILFSLPECNDVLTAKQRKKLMKRRIPRLIMPSPDILDDKTDDISIDDDF